MACRCSNVVIIVDPPGGTCTGCLKVVSLRIGCDDGPDPCGDTGSIDLSTYNDLSACDGCTPVYSLVSYDEDGFASATVSSVGLLEFTTSDNYVRHEEYSIIYKVDCPCDILSATGAVYICMKNPCDPCDEGEECNPCTGNCDPIDPEIQVDGTPEIIVS